MCDSMQRGSRRLRIVTPKLHDAFVQWQTAIKIETARPVEHTVKMKMPFTDGPKALNKGQLSSPTMHCFPRNLISTSLSASRYYR